MTQNLTKNQKLIYELIKQNGGVNHKVTLAKLQYLSDFIHFAFHSQVISDPTIIYTHQDHGPLARSLSEDIDTLKTAGLISEKDYKYKVIEDKDLELSEDESKTIRFVVEKYGKTSWQDLKRISHDQAPYRSTKEGEVVEFFTAYNLIDEYPDYETFS